MTEKEIRAKGFVAEQNEDWAYAPAIGSMVSSGRR